MSMHVSLFVKNEFGKGLVRCGLSVLLGVTRILRDDVLLISRTLKCAT